MKTLYLYDINKTTYHFIFLDVKDKLENYGDIVDDGITLLGKCDFDITKNIDPKFIEYLKSADTIVNFGFDKNKKFIIPSPLTEKNLKTNNSYTVVAICLNLQGNRVGLICIDRKGDFHKCEINNMIEVMKQSPALSNMYLKHSTGELVLTKGNFLNDSSMVPIIKVGQRLKKVKEEKVNKNINNESDLSIPLQVMIQKGYKKWVDKFNLYNLAYPEDTLWFYLSMFENKEFNEVENMLTTDPYDTEQLEELRQGLVDGVGIREYADPDIDADEMKKIRIALNNKTFAGVPLPKQLKKLQNKMARTKDYDGKISKQIIDVKKAISKNRKKEV